MEQLECQDDICHINSPLLTPSLPSLAGPLGEGLSLCPYVHIGSYLVIRPLVFCFINQLAASKYRLLIIA